MTRFSLPVLRTFPLLLLGPLVGLTAGQDELVPAEPGMDDPLAEDPATELYTFEDGGLELFDRRRRDGVPPIGIRSTEENLPAGATAMRIRVSRTSYDGLGDGRDSVSSAAVFGAGYTVAPTSLTEDRVEFEFVHGFDERWTVWAVLPFLEKELEADIMGGGTSTSRTSGIGDVRIGGNYLLHEDDHQRVNVGLGLTIPTGEDDSSDTYGAVADARLPYVMRLGGGTFDVMPSAGWVRLLDDWSMGARAWGRFPIGENSDDWAISRDLDVDFWVAREFSDALTGTLRLNAEWWGDVRGDDLLLDPTNSPLEDSGLQGGTRLNLIGGIAWDLETRTEPAANRLELEVGIPIDERLDGPALQREWSVRFGWKLSL